VAKPLHNRKLIKIKLTYMLRISRCEIVPKIMEIGAVILKRWAFKYSGLTCFCRKAKFLNLQLGGTTYFTNLFNINLTEMFRTIVFKYNKNCANLFRYFEDVDSQTQWPRFFWLTLYILLPMPCELNGKIDRTQKETFRLSAYANECHQIKSYVFTYLCSRGPEGSMHRDYCIWSLLTSLSC